jgi:hypothetical protein
VRAVTLRAFRPSTCVPTAITASHRCVPRVAAACAARDAVELTAGGDSSQEAPTSGKARNSTEPARALFVASASPYRRCIASMTLRTTTMRSMLAAAVLPVAVAGVVFFVARSRLDRDREPLAPFRVRLGMTPADVRATFAPPAAGTSQWRLDSSGANAIEWRGSGRSFRFEFHNAQLMAVRAILESRDPSTHGDALEVSTATVLRRRAREDGRVELTLLARDCPTHAEEARRLINSR